LTDREEEKEEEWCGVKYIHNGQGAGEHQLSSHKHGLLLGEMFVYLWQKLILPRALSFVDFGQKKLKLILNGEFYTFSARVSPISACVPNHTRTGFHVTR
jgi:hypothetical protein